MGLKKQLTTFLRRFKLSYTLSNLWNRSKLERNRQLYKKYGIQKAAWRSVSNKDFKHLPAPPLPWLDQQSLKTLAPTHPDFLAFPKNIQQELIGWSENGYAILKGYFKKEADEVNKNIQNLLDTGKIQFRYGNKLMFALHQDMLIRTMAQQPQLNAILSFLLGKPVEIFQSINFITGSQQRAHSDSIHMTTYPLGYLIAIWVALEDIEEEQGALFYYPGSHKLPYLLNEDFDHGGSYFRIGKEANKRYEDTIEELVKQQQLKKQVFTAKKGDVLIWHANLLHGGSPVASPDLTRRSMVFHYYAKDVIRYHEITQRPTISKMED